MPHREDLIRKQERALAKKFFEPSLDCIFTNASHGDRVYERIVRAATGYDMLTFI